MKKTWWVSGKVAHVSNQNPPKASHVLPPRSDLACYTVGSRQGVSGGWMDEWMVSIFVHFHLETLGKWCIFWINFWVLCRELTYPRHFWKDDFTCPGVGYVSCFLEGKDVSNGLKTPGLFAMRTSELPLYHRLAFPRQELETVGNQWQCWPCAHDREETSEVCTVTFSMLC